MRNYLTAGIHRGIASRAIQITAAVGIAAGIMLAGNTAQGAIVPNFFVRSCTFTDTNCSPYAQTNPPF
jgi:hypothetical protein